VVVIELGANDGLRGLDLAQTRANLERMITAAKQSGARVLLLGMRLPPNYGPQYTQGFERNYAELAKAHGAALLPFLLEPIATEREAFQADNLHPVAEAQPRLRDHVWPALEPLLR
jgi:acyl-CoA thioesterase-1